MGERGANCLVDSQQHRHDQRGQISAQPTGGEHQPGRGREVGEQREQVQRRSALMKQLIDGEREIEEGGAGMAPLEPRIGPQQLPAMRRVPGPELEDGAVTREHHVGHTLPQKLHRAGQERRRGDGQQEQRPAAGGQSASERAPVGPLQRPSTRLASAVGSALVRGPSV